ncbi:PepSY domain-containing protein [Clostridium botulinum]|nr:PepSY domain-containing protein [Clostridium botulinum]
MKIKKLLPTLLSATITFSSVSSIYAEGPVGKKSKTEQKITTIYWEKSNKKSNTNMDKKKFNNFEEINDFFQQNISKFGLKKGSLKNTKTLKDEKGRTHYHTIYQLENIPVYYGRIVFTTEKDCTMSSISGRVDTAFENGNWESKIKLSKNAAIENAKNDIKYAFLAKEKVELYLYNFNGTPYVVYLVDLITDSGYWKVFVNAENGSIVNKFNNTPTLIDTKEKER